MPLCICLTDITGYVCVLYVHMHALSSHPYICIHYCYTSLSGSETSIQQLTSQSILCNGTIVVNRSKKHYFDHAMLRTLWLCVVSRHLRHPYDILHNYQRHQLGTYEKPWHKDRVASITKEFHRCYLYATFLTKTRSYIREKTGIITLLIY